MAGAHTISDSGSSEEDDRNTVSIADQLKKSTADSKKVVSKAVAKTLPTKIASKASSSFSVAKFIDDCSSSDEEYVTKPSGPSAPSTIVSSKKTSPTTPGNSRTVKDGGSTTSSIGIVNNSENPKTKVSSQKRSLADISDEEATDIDEEMVEKLEDRYRNKKRRVESKPDVTNSLSHSHTLSDSDDEQANDNKQHKSAKKTITPSKSKSNDSIPGRTSNPSTPSKSSKPSKQSPTLLTPSPTPKAASKFGPSSSPTTPQSTPSPSSRPSCRYGLTCYRQKQAHWNKVSHPDEKCETGKGGKLIWTRPSLSLSSSQKNSSIGDDDFDDDDDDQDMWASLADDAMDNPSSLNSSWTNPSLIKVLSDAEPHNYFLTKVSGIHDRFNATHALSMKDILSPLLGTLESSVQFNYCIDIDWMMSQYPPQCRQLPVLVVHGLSREAKAELAAQAESFSPHVRLAQAKLPDPFGTHHTKMMILKYKEGLRVAITTANLVAHDWAQKTQGIWLSPLFPRLDDPSRGESAGDSKTCFKKDLLNYLRAYRLPQLKPIEDIILAHDLSSCKVFLLGSIPGRHQGVERTKWGHMRLRRILEDHQVAPSKPKGTPTLNMSKTDDDAVGKSWYLLAQFSSVGSLGNAASQWLQAEFSASLSSLNPRGGDPSAKGPFNPLANAASCSSKFRLVFPTVEDVGNSLEGYQAGASIPYARATASKQPWLKSLMHRWRADGRGRTRAAPHIKSFAQIDPSSSKIAWFASTSANLSKAAWGALEKNQSQLFIRSYELGVLFLPQYFEDDVDGNGSYFCVKRVMETGNGRGLAFPLDLPLTPYGQYDEPWLWDANHTKKLDSHGCTWEPNKQSR